jgi:hypothetical protein
MIQDRNLLIASAAPAHGYALSPTRPSTPRRTHQFEGEHPSS